MGKFKKILMAVFASAFLASPIFAEGTGNGTTQVSMSQLWQDLGVDLGSIFTNVIQTIASPIGVVISVVFVMTILYFVVWLGRSAIKKRIGFN